MTTITIISTPTADWLITLGGADVIRIQAIEGAFVPDPSELFDKKEDDE